MFIGLLRDGRNTVFECKNLEIERRLERKEVTKNATHCLLCCIFLCTYYIGLKHDNLILF